MSLLHYIYLVIFNLPRNNEDAEDIYHKNGFLITHLLSQVRIGMDLSRILLPTFILENRSLLEMYADFLAHTDFFISIAQQKSPQDRMIAVLKWYVSSFHTAWDVKTAKKPYNPILGEFFECSYKCDETTKSDQVYFISEQISHHPPVSAFYAESCENHIYIEGHIWTKSKFYGLSVGVDLIGGATIYLKEFNEHYKISFPSAFAKSILTVPTVEIGGDVKIVCQETNYKSKISFHLKPFYGGSRHRVSAKISNMTTNKSFYILDGYWNSVFSGKRVHLNTNHFVFDTKNCNTHKKIIKKVSQQKPNESRNLWKNVTKALYRNDIALATQHKFGLEQIQREEASYRKTNSIKWFPKYFTKEADGWVSYINKMS
ncbi:hypothetical protein A3Q56_03768 [Intoshia linei]|uniref:Oxysterol-binding protein n=1 Tax=Intoshia linei TaxID=1819745 RepID=A0A177B2Z6_9BILA|nr:hypothetical protein A3Q56_03768 [Intoshia linei]